MGMDKVAYRVKNVENVIEDINLRMGNVVQSEQENYREENDILNSIESLAKTVNYTLKEIRSFSMGLDEMIKETKILNAEGKSANNSLEEVDNIDLIFDDIYRMLEDTAEMVNDMISSIHSEKNVVLEEIEFV